MTILAMDFGGTQLKAALISDDLEKMEHLPVQASPKDKTETLDKIDNLVLPYLEQISGLAVSLPGTVDTDQGIVYHGGSLAFLHEWHLKAELEKKYTKPVVAINDGKAAVLAEHEKGHLRGVTNGAALVLGTGLGGGLVLNGQLFQGSHFQAGELTFLFDDQEGPHSVKDMRGSEVSAVGLIRRLAKQLQLSNLDDGKAVFQALNDKTASLYSVFEDYCRQVALTIYNLQTTLDMDCFVIGGGISEQPLLITEINAQFDRLHGELDFIQTIVKRPKIIACQFHNSANLLGAALFYKQRY